MTGKFKTTARRNAGFFNGEKKTMDYGLFTGVSALIGVQFYSDRRVESPD